jgi:isopenicillin N synthase-like dioxygenase
MPDLDLSLSETTLASARRLFNEVPLESKLHEKMGNASMRGYIPFGAESGLKDTHVEPKEGWAYGRPTAVQQSESSYLASANRWPDEQVYDLGDRALLEALFDKSVHYSRLTVQAILGDDTTMLDGGEKISLMRIFHYFAVEAQEQAQEQELGNAEGTSTHTTHKNGNSDGNGNSERKKKVLGSSPHRDWGLLTLILQVRILCKHLRILGFLHILLYCSSLPALFLLLSFFLSFFLSYLLPACIL